MNEDLKIFDNKIRTFPGSAIWASHFQILVLHNLIGKTNLAGGPDFYSPIFRVDYLRNRRHIFVYKFDTLGLLNLPDFPFLL